MELEEYQDQATKTNIYSQDDWGMIALALGVVGEAGEVADKMKKMLRDCVDNTEQVADELGDVLWYISQLAPRIGYNLEDIASRNLEKLQSRQERNVIGGSGDDR